MWVNILAWKRLLFLLKRLVFLLPITVFFGIVPASEGVPRGFPLVMMVGEEEMVAVHNRLGGDCADRGPSVLFVVENKSPDRVSLSFVLTKGGRSNRLKVTAAANGNTSVMSMAMGDDACGWELAAVRMEDI